MRIPSNVLAQRPGGMAGGRPQVWKPCPSCGGDVVWDTGEGEQSRPTYRPIRTWNPDRDPDVRLCRREQAKRDKRTARMIEELRPRMESDPPWQFLCGSRLGEAE